MRRGLALLSVLVGALACAVPGDDASSGPTEEVRVDRAAELQAARSALLAQLDELRSGLAGARAGIDSLGRMVGRMNSVLDSVETYVSVEGLDVSSSVVFDLRLRGDGLVDASTGLLARLDEAAGQLDAAEALLLDSLDRLEALPIVDDQALDGSAELDALARTLEQEGAQLQTLLDEADALVAASAALTVDAERLQEDVRRQLSEAEPMGMKSILRDPATDVEVSVAPGSAADAAAAAWRRDEVAELVTSKGTIVLEFFADDAPRHVQNFKRLARDDFYDGQQVHRVVPGFLVQAGCPVGNGTGGPGYQIRNEFNERPHERGTLSMARFAHPDSAGSQFFIALTELPQYDGKYTVFGRMIKGRNALTRIEDLGSLDGSTEEPVIIEDVVLRERRDDERAADG